MSHGKEHPEMCWQQPLAAAKLRESSVMITWNITQIVFCICLVSLEVCKIAQNEPKMLTFYLMQDPFPSSLSLQVYPNQVEHNYKLVTQLPKPGIINALKDLRFSLLLLSFPVCFSNTVYPSFDQDVVVKQAHVLKMDTPIHLLHNIRMVI